MALSPPPCRHLAPPSSTPGGQGGAGHWRSTRDAATGKTYYYNRRTKEVSWTSPPGLAKEDNDGGGRSGAGAGAASPELPPSREGRGEWAATPGLPRPTACRTSRRSRSWRIRSFAPEDADLDQAPAADGGGVRGQSSAA